MKKVAKYILIVLMAILVLGWIMGAMGFGNFNKNEALQGKYINIEGVDIRYIEKGVGRDVLLIHGTPGSIEDMQGLFDVLSKDHHVVAYDRPGHGFSSGDNIPRNIAHNTLIAQGMLAQFEMDSALVIGHSYGGIISMNMAIEGSDKVKRFYILGSPLFSFECENIYKLFKVPVLNTSLSWLASGWYAEGKIENELPQRFDSSSAIPNKAFVDFRTHLWSQPKVILSKSLETAHLFEDYKAMVPQYDELKNDVTVILGTSDVPHYISDLKRHLPIKRMRVKYYEKTGHFIQMERLDDLLAEIDADEMVVDTLINQN